jgi:PPOX class probable F420-dependent enzyme
VAATDELWAIIAAGRDGIVATADEDGTPQLSNIFYLADPDAARISFSTTTTRRKGRNLLRFPRAALHVAGRDFYNFAVAEGDVSVAIATGPDDDAVDELYRIHSALGAASARDGFAERMVADNRMAVRIEVTRLYGQRLER